MNKNRMKKLVSVGLTVWGIMFAVSAEEPKNITENSGFEQIKPYTVPEKLKEFIVASEIPVKWGVNSYSPSKLSIIADAETSHGGSNYIRIEQLDKNKSGAFCYGTRIPVNAGEKYSLSVWAKGEGTLMLRCYAYSKVAALKSPSSNFIKISPEWKEYKIEIVIPAGAVKISPAFHIQGIVNLDDVKFCRISE